MKAIWLVFALLLQLCPTRSQIPVGEWRDHLPYAQATSITAGHGRIYCAAGSALFFLDRSDNSLSKLSKVNGLSDIGISTIGYSPETDILLVAYTNTNIDLISGNQIFNLSDIYRKPLPGEKTIYHVLFIGKYAYLSCGFGIVVVNLEKREIKDTYYIGENGSMIRVFGMAFDGTYLYAATESGVYKADINNPNLIYYTAWNRITGLPGPDKKYSGVIFFNQSIYVNRSDDTFETDTLYRYTGVSWEAFDTRMGIKNFSLKVARNKLFISGTRLLRMINENHEVERLVDSYGYAQPKPGDALIDNQGVLWIADNDLGIIKNANPNVFESIYPNGPFSDHVAHLDITGGKLRLAGGGRDPGWSGIYNIGEIYTFIEGSWKSILNYEIRDVVRVLGHPVNPNIFYAGSWGYGLLEYSNNQLENHYGENNSTLQSIIPGDNYVRIGGMAFDRDLNLWITNSGVDNPVSVLKRNGEWRSFPLGNQINAPTISDIIVTAYGHKWLLLPRGFGLFAFDENRTIDNLNDDRYRKFSVTDQEGNTMNDIYSIAEDLDGNIWVGTSQGPLIYFNPENVFSDDDFRAQRIKVPRNDGSGLADYLLGTETITAIAVDGANRKWIGTEDAGIFLLSADGQKEIHHFNEKNSPLFSNRITTIAIDQESGEVFFGTGKGVISFRGTATKGTEEFGRVYVFPNPVREDYSGPITITGLVSDVNVKITDISGNIVYETTALGGQAIWDGRTFSGKKVHSGVYLIMCTNEDGSKTHVAKLLVIH